MKVLYSLVLFLFLSLIAPSIYAASDSSISCKVVGISDGDTLTCLYKRKPLKVRLLYIDAPESAQPYGNKAKQALANLVFKKQVILHSSSYDRYQRLLAVVYDEQERNINLLLVQKGMAWAYRETLPIYEQAMLKAKQAQKGLWQDKSPINPAEWRKTHSADKRSDSGWNWQNIWKKRPLVKDKTLDCERMLRCSDFSDYQSAKRYFDQCGSKTMDGNNDGIPCNKLYREALH
ncbi:thermonuclease family protein [Actinobacillus equuli]|uniref:Micrococcal nuclease (Thermonuclease)-like protein n=1 Tax=Actinobacillus equuli TaxID=718 RepID=A0AAX3FKF5_ACTEU|nr:thermonuclease family protein [Actinobacillus equuli]AIZ79364.1 nuclease [Actinobacillus equuli subsp. equuli]WGE43482.1 thermonuclease family protein [Actinobacillus equuli subsp. equuli]VEE89802.1 putative micrococcal nuclease (thermonuclease)-like protein [Actinobacillus equuli]